MTGFASAFVPSLLRATALLALSAVIISVMVRLLRPSSLRLQRVAWVLVLIQGGLLFRLPVTVPWHGSSPADAPRMAKAESEFERRTPTDEGPRVRPAPFRAPTFWWNWPSIALVVWLAGVVGLPAVSLIAYLRFLVHLRLKDVTETEWVREWKAILTEIGVERSIPLQTSPDLGPMLCWLPGGYRVVVPERLWGGLTPAQRVAILRHEAAHYRRGDLGESLAVRGLALVHWFNPFAWWAVRGFEECAEWACDTAATGGARAKAVDYAKALIQACEASRKLSLWGAGARGHSLSVRIRRLLATAPREDSTMRKTALLGVATLLVVSGMVRIDLAAQGPERVKPDEPGVLRGAGYLVFPVKTELQRLLISGFTNQNAEVFVALNGSALLPEGRANEAVLEAIHRDLGRIVSKGGEVHFDIFFGRSSPGFDHERMKATLARLAAGLGLRAEMTSERHNDEVTWQERIATIEGSLPAPTEREAPAFGGDVSAAAVKAYPVRTYLSRYLSDGADCVVDILKPLAGASDEAILGPIRSSVSKLELVRKRHIVFRLQDRPHEEARERIFEELLRLAQSLGFQQNSLRW